MEQSEHTRTEIRRSYTFTEADLRRLLGQELNMITGRIAYVKEDDVDWDISQGALLKGCTVTFVEVTASDE